MPSRKPSPRRAVVPVADDPEFPWERQPKESARAWQCFKLYLEMPPAKRSLTTLGRTLSVSKVAMCEQSVRHNWQARVRAYDRHLDRIEQAEVEAEVKRLARNNVKLAMGMQGILGKRLKEMAENVGHRELTAKDIPAYLRALAHVEQGARGTRVEHSGPGGGPIETRDADARARLARILGAVKDEGEGPT